MKTQASKAPKLSLPSQLDVPSYLMNFPFSLSIDDPNNIWMEELTDEEREKLNIDTALAQYMELYNFMASAGVVYILPSLGEYQDQVYVANLGLVLPHIHRKQTVILANFRSKPRQGEDRVGRMFFRMCGFDVFQPDTHWEGEADLKWLRDDIYIGGYGIRTDPLSYKWMAKHFGMKIIPVEMTDEYLYHFDCLCFPITKEKILLCTELLDPADVKQVEKVAEVIDVDADMAYDGTTNSVRFHNQILTASSITELSESDDRFKGEKKKVEFLTKVCTDLALEPVFFNLSQFELSGAMLSCCVMHLNRESFEVPLQ